MNIETRVEPRLWDAIRSTYESRNFSAAILDALHFISELIREKSGLDGDGANLVGRAFGGKTPILKVNGLRTESERNVQAGVEQLLRGLYQAIRNPRSHGANQDTEDDAVAIILLVNYLIKTIDRAKAPFSHQTFVKRVLDPDFVPSQRYAELLVTELPDSKRLEVFHDIFRQINEGDAAKLKHFFCVLLDKMTEEEKGEVSQAITEVLRDAEETEPIRKILQAFPGAIWPTLAEVSRLRAEHKLIRSVDDGSYHVGQNRCRGGAFGTWASNIVPHFSSKAELLHTLLNKLSSSDFAQQEYVFRYFSHAFAQLCAEPSKRLIETVNSGLEAGDVRFKKLVENQFFWEGEDWISPFKQSLDQFQEAGSDFDPNDDVPF